jgi:TusA-related sulfurtransferase
MGSDIVPDAELDCVGLYCPMPIAQTKQEIDKLEVGQVLKVEADDQAQGIDLLERGIHMDLMEMFIEVEDDVITDTKFKPCLSACFPIEILNVTSTKSITDCQRCSLSKTSMNSWPYMHNISHSRLILAPNMRAIRAQGRFLGAIRIGME